MDRQERKRKRLQDKWGQHTSCESALRRVNDTGSYAQFLKGGRQEAPKAKTAAQDEASVS